MLSRSLNRLNYVALFSIVVVVDFQLATCWSRDDEMPNTNAPCYAHAFQMNVNKNPLSYAKNEELLDKRAMARAIAMKMNLYVEKSHYTIQ